MRYGLICRISRAVLGLTLILAFTAAPVGCSRSHWAPCGTKCKSGCSKGGCKGAKKKCDCAKGDCKCKKGDTMAKCKCPKGDCKCKKGGCGGKKG